jgi:5'-3' exonuclease/transcription antitermination factor NusG
MSAELQWVVLELTSKAENEDPDMVRASIRHHIRNAEVFVPASIVQRGEQRVFHYLMEGYAFIQNQHPASHYNRLIDTKYVQGPLYMPTGHKRDKRLATISAPQINELRRQIKVEVDQGIEVHDTVTITSGPYKNISALVREEIPEHDSVTVHIQLRSTDRLVTLPRAFLRLKSKPLHVVYRSNLEAIARWAEMALQLACWSGGGFEKIHRTFRKLRQLDDLLRRTRERYLSIRAYHARFDLEPLRSKFLEFQRLRSGALLRSQILAVRSPPNLSPVAKKHQDVVFLSNACARIFAIYMDVKKMTEPSPMNLVVDGTQLFIRCLSAPGLSDLTDSQGRSTGAVVGFLRSLGAYKKRFPEAQVYVCWDGSSQRRKAMYPEYKANRVSRTEKTAPLFEANWLRENLPIFGVLQAFNPVEEADDVMAALVRGPLRDCPNILISTDRDLIQLVSEFTHQLCPKVGAGKEKLYNPALVKSEYGVPPSSMVHLRALSGDSSDNIPGVSGFGLKTAAKLIKLYGTVTRLLESNLAGMGKAQMAKLRASQQQVLKNVDLLSLQDVQFDQIGSNPNQREAEARLNELEIKPDPILAAFFP